MTDQELRRAVDEEKLKKLCAQRRKREEREWQERLDAALLKRGYPPQHGRRRR